MFEAQRVKLVNTEHYIKVWISTCWVSVSQPKCLNSSYICQDLPKTGRGKKRTALDIIHLWVLDSLVNVLVHRLLVWQTRVAWKEDRTKLCSLCFIQSSLLVLFCIPTIQHLFSLTTDHLLKGSPDCSRLPNVLSRVVPCSPLPVLRKSCLT